MALYKLTSDEDFAKINRLPSRAQTQVYDALNGNTGANDNFFTKRAKSVENALGTTLSVLPAWAAVGNEDRAIEQRLQDYKASMNNIAKKYGYNTYHDVWDARDAAEASGDTATLERIDNIITPELQAQAKANADNANQAAKNWQDFRENSYIGQKTNQDNTKFLGSAINTLSTATDVLGLTNGPVSNAIQGGIEGFADELEQNGGTLDLTELFTKGPQVKNWDNFDIERAAQNALTGAATGAVTGLVNKGISNNLAKKGGNLFKGGNKLTQGINDLGSKTAVGRGISTLATGAGRGAISGAVGGATGAGLQSALNGVELGQGIANTFQAAAQGAGQGALAGTAMAGANMAINKTPFMQKVNQAKQDWQNSGETFNERLANTYANDDGRLVNTRLGQKVGSWIDNKYTDRVNSGAKARLANALTRSIANEAQGGITGDTKFVRLTEDRIKDINILREAQGFTPLDDRQIIAYENALNKNLVNRIKEGMNVDDVVNMAYESLMSPNAEALPGNDGTTNTMMVAPYRDRFNSSIIDDFEGTTSLKSIEPRSTNKVNSPRAIKNDLLGQSGSPLAANQEGGVTQTSSLEGSTSLGEATPLRTRSGIVSQNEQNVNDLTSVFEPDANKTIQNRNKLQSVGQQLQTAAKTQKYGALYDSLDAKTAARAVKTGAPETLTKLGVRPENYLEAAKTSDYVNKVVSDLAEQSNVKVNVPDLVDRLSLDNVDVIISEPAAKKYNSYIKQIIPDGSNPDEYSAGYLLQKSRELGNKAANLRGNTDDVNTLRTALTDAKYTLRDLAASALENSELTGDLTNDNIAKGLAKMGANEAIQDYYTEAVDGKAPSITDYIRRSSLFEQARDMGTQIEAEKYTRSASKAPTNPFTRVWNATGLDQPVNTLLKNTVAPIAGGLTNAAGKVVEGAGNLAAKVGGSTPSSTTATPSVSDTAYNPATQIYNAIGRTEGEIQGEKAVEERASNYLEQASKDTAAESLGGTGTTSATSVYDTMTGNNSTVSSATANSTLIPRTGDYWADILAGAMERAIADNDVAAFGSLYEMYKEAISKQTSTSASQTKLTDKQRQANAAALALDELEQLEPDTAYNLSDIPVIGGIATLGGNSYETAAKSLAQQVGYMLSGANVTKDEAENIGKAYVPLPRDNETIRQQKLNKIRGIISEYQRTYSE